MTKLTLASLSQPRVLLAAALLSGLFVSAGCRNSGFNLPASGSDGSDTPTSYPPTPALFSEALPTEASADALLTSAVMPPKPSDPTQLMQQAGVPDSPPPGAAQSFGLIVCDPSPSPGLETFGSGCGRWLDLVASGQPELGRTPSWQSRARAQQEMGRNDFGLTSQQAAALRGMTAV